MLPWHLMVIIITNLSRFSCFSTCQLRTFRGHTNEKNFVGLTVNSEYIACGSETNEVFVYHKVTTCILDRATVYISRVNRIIIRFRGSFAGYFQTSSLA